MQNDDAVDVDVAADVAAPKKERKARAAKIDPETGLPVVKAPRVPKEKKPPVPTLKDKFIRVNVKAEDTKLRKTSGRYSFLKAAEDATKCSDIIGGEHLIGDKVVKLTGANIIGMFSRGHISLSKDGETWETVQTTVVTE